MEYLLQISANSGSFNKILRRIWKLPHASHTAVVHCTAGLHSLLIRFFCGRTSCSAQPRNLLLPPSEQSSSIPLRSATPPSAITCWLVTNLQKHTWKWMLKLEQCNIRLNHSLTILGNPDELILTLSCSYYQLLYYYTNVLCCSFCRVLIK